MGSPQNENRCIYKGRGRLPRPSKSHLQKTKPNLQMALSGTGQSVPSQVDTSVHISGCTQLVNVSSNHAMVTSLPRRHARWRFCVAFPLVRQTSRICCHCSLCLGKQHKCHLAWVWESEQYDLCPIRNHLYHSCSNPKEVHAC